MREGHICTQYKQANALGLSMLDVNQMSLA